ncbi:AB-hydrolase YheT [Marasmius fiardii PR-910]|nr:AB-hydrolase YheT [Marasmius fiardii PR-910]
MGVLSWSTKTEVHFHLTPVQLPVHKHSQFSQTGDKVSLKKFIDERCPSLFKRFAPPWYLFNGHLQTLYCVVGDFTKTDKVVYDRTLLRTFTGGTIGLDFTVGFDNAKDDTPIIVVLHGLTGGSYEHYVRGILYPACSPVEKGGLGYRAVVMNYRGCAGVPITSRQFYSAGFTDDIRTSLMYIQRKYPKAPLLGIGFSLGANVLIRYLAEEQEKSKLIAGCALGCPWDLRQNCDAIDSTFIGRQVYSKGMGSNLCRVLKRHEAAIVGINSSDVSPCNSTSTSLSPYAHPSYQPNPAFEAAVAQAARTILATPTPYLRHFDDTFTCVAGGAPPIMPKSSANEYYHWASSHRVLKNVKRPLLTLNASDDPVVRHVPDPLEEGNEWTVIAVTGGGGHLGWFVEAGDGNDQFMIRDDGDNSQIRRWSTGPVLQWFKGIVEDLDLDTGSWTYIEDSDGWVQEVGGRDDIAYKIVGDTESREDLVNGTELRKEGGMLQGL